jgi:hypothetical protein
MGDLLLKAIAAWNDEYFRWDWEFNQGRSTSVAMRFDRRGNYLPVRVEPLPVAENQDEDDAFAIFRDAKAARAFLAALREPTQAMLDSCYGVTRAPDGSVAELLPEALVAQIWRAMIDKALE